MSPKQSLNVTNSFVDYKIIHTNFFAFPTIVRCDGNQVTCFPDRVIKLINLLNLKDTKNFFLPIIYPSIKNKCQENKGNDYLIHSLFRTVEKDWETVWRV